MACVFSFKSSGHLIIKYEDLVVNTFEILDVLSSFLKIDLPHHITEKFNQKTKTKDFSKVRQPKLVEKIQNTWIDRWKKPEYADRVENFMKHSQAVYWLKHARYSF